MDIYIILNIILVLVIITGIVLIAVLTNFFGNHTNKTPDPITSSVVQNPTPDLSSDCIGIGPESNYTLYDTLDTSKTELLKTCEGLISRNGVYKFILESDGNFNLYENNVKKYSSNSAPGKKPFTMRRYMDNKYPYIYDSTNTHVGSSPFSIYNITDAGDKIVMLKDNGYIGKYTPLTTIVPPIVDLSPEGKTITNVFIYNYNKYTITENIEPETSGMLKDILKVVNPTLMITYCSKKVLDLLYGNIVPSDRPKNISITFTNTPIISAMAYAMGPGITYSIPGLLDVYKSVGKDIIKIKNEMVGVMMHELTHVFQYGQYSNQLYTEGIAEYVRMSSGFVVDWPGEIPDKSPTFNTPYGAVPAYFLIWLNNKYPGIIIELNKSFKTTFNVSNVIKTYTNNVYSNIDTLWVEYQTKLKQ